LGFEFIELPLPRMSAARNNLWNLIDFNFSVFIGSPIVAYASNTLIKSSVNSSKIGIKSSQYKISFSKTLFFDTDRRRLVWLDSMDRVDMLSTCSCLYYERIVEFFRMELDRSRKFLRSDWEIIPIDWKLFFRLDRELLGHKLIIE
jgi:hypothetical protein